MAFTNPPTTPSTPTYQVSTEQTRTASTSNGSSNNGSAGQNTGGQAGTWMTQKTVTNTVTISATSVEQFELRDGKTK